ncbi:MAG: hypothetical protein KAQ81_00100, partial [Deltaproteobacteria bacterium]|nr:hypothetical protein [Deltaproteobacteria bacterium]
TEAQRVAALALSGVAGGDGCAVVLDADAGGVTDMGTNTNLIDDNNAVAETADTNNPSLSSWSLDLTAPTLTLNFSETVDVSTRDLTALTAQDAATATGSHTLTTSDTASGDGTSVVIDLSIADKAGIRAFAVDIGTSYLRTTNLLIDDMAGNANSVIADGTAMQAGAYTGPTAASASNTTVIASPTILFTGGTAIITVTPKDAGGANLGPGEPVSLSTTFGSLLGAVSDVGDGTYTQSLKSLVAGSATVTATVGGVVIDQKAVVTFYSPPIVSTTTSVSPSTTTSLSPSTTTSVSPITSTISSTSSIVSSSTTSISLLWPMAYDKMWGAGKDENLLLLRLFRDEILLNTEFGREYVFMLYDNSLEIVTLLLQEPSLTMQTKEVIDELLIGIESLLYADEIQTSQDTIDNVVSLLNNFKSYASPKLKTAIKKLKKNINEGEVFKRLVITISE